jgi:hypothetical protein
MVPQMKMRVDRYEICKKTPFSIGRKTTAATP